MWLGILIIHHQRQFGLHKIFCAIQKCGACDMNSLPQPSVKAGKDALGVLFNFTKNFKLVFCSVFELSIFCS